MTIDYVGCRFLHNERNTEQTEEKMDNSSKPVHKIRYGNVSCAVWLNGSPAGYFYNTTFSRVYKDGEQWGESASFEDRDLPNLMKASADAHTWIHQQKANAVTTGATDDP